jgi:epoxyqueuosine reductase
VDNQELAQQIKKTALESGYADCGITSVEPFTRFEDAVRKHMDLFPEAKDHYEAMLYRTDPRVRSPWARSIVVCVMHYGKYIIPPQVEGKIGRHYLFDRRYEGCPDHEIPKKFKQGLQELGMRVKKGGTPDRWAGVRAGVATFGKNSFVFTDKHGSWINIEPWLVDAELPPDEPSLEIPCPDGCTACIKACPTQALCAPFEMRIDRCIAHLTYSGPGPEDEDTKQQMGLWIYGCDECQTACPRTKGTWQETESAPWLEDVLPLLSPQKLASMNLETYREKIHPLFWYINDDEQGLKRWHSNAKRSINNSYGQQS